MYRLPILLSLLAVVCLSGCILAPYYRDRRNCLPTVQNDPYVPGVPGSLGDMLSELPFDPSGDLVFSEYAGWIPQADQRNDAKAAMSELMSGKFVHTGEYARFFNACYFARTPLRWDGSSYLSGSPWLRAYAFCLSEYDEAIVLETAEKLYCGRYAEFVPQNDLVYFHFAFVARFGMRRLNETLDKIYARYGQVQIPPIYFPGLVPPMVDRVVASAATLEPAEQGGRLGSVAFGLTGRYMVTHDRVSDLYASNPCNSFAYELLERGDFTVLRRNQLMLTYHFGNSQMSFNSPVCQVLQKLWSHSDHTMGRPVMSGEVLEVLERAGVWKPEELWRYVSSNYGRARDVPYFGERSREGYNCPAPDFREYPAEAANSMLANWPFADEMEASRAVGSESALGGVMASFLSSSLHPTAVELPSPPLVVLAGQRVFPDVLVTPYYSPTSLRIGERWAWNSLGWKGIREANCIAFARFFGDKWSWSERSLAFGWVCDEVPGSLR